LAKPLLSLLSRVPHPCGFQSADFEFLFGSLRSLRSSPVSLSHQTTKFPPTPSISSTSPRLIRMISTQVLYLDSNSIPCYHSPCFARTSLPRAGLSVAFALADCYARPFFACNQPSAPVYRPSRSGNASLFHQSRVTSHKSLSPLQSALPKNTPLTLLESALPKPRT